MADTPFEGWAILELFGHRRLGGYVRDVEVFGGRMCRIDIPGPNKDDGDHPPYVATQFYGAAALFSLTPCSPEAALAVARGNQPAPVHRWELPDSGPTSIPQRPLHEVEDDGPNCDPDDEDERPF